jgi:phenylacetate-coenzyme A ligase PaaK-like adenylate-forming protein
VGILARGHTAVIRAAFTLWYGPTAYGRCASLLQKTQWWPPREIEALQTKKLRALLRHCHATVEFYQKRFDTVGVRVEDVKSANDLQRIPILTKKDIQLHGTLLKSHGMSRRRLIQNHSGGSTGHPVTFYQDSNYKAWEQADMLRSYRMAGYDLGMHWAFLWGSDYDARTHKGRLGRLQDRVIYNLLWINTFDLTADTLARAAEILARWQPKLIVAYVSSATLLAQLVRERNIRGIRPRSIQTSAEVLTSGARKLIEETFGCPVFNRYGCREVGNIAHECEAHHGLHVLAENNLVELLNKDDTPAKPGEVGRVVVTNLNNYTMPFIRYEVGDLAIASTNSCSCGRSLPLMHSVEGRVTDVILSPSGKLLHGEFFTHLFYRLDGIEQFRVVQETVTELHIQIVPARNFEKEKTLIRLREMIHRHGDPEFEIHFELQSHIPPAPSGKYRFTVSNLPADSGVN